jgi:glycosyltransferase involved in cell wall biosynthesis
MNGAATTGVAVNASARDSDRTHANPNCRVLLVAPSLRFLGGQAIQAQRLRDHLRQQPWVSVDLLPVDPVLPAPLNRLQRIKYVRTVVTTLAYVASLFRTVPRYDVIHAFSASYWSFLLAPAPAVLVARLFGKRAIVNYRSGEADDHLTRWGWHAIPLLRLSKIVVPSGYLVAVFRKFGLSATSIPNFLDLDSLPYRRRTNVRPKFLSNRNFEAHYNVASILRAFAVIQASVPEATLDVVGDGPERERLHALAAELQLQHVTFVGPVPPKDMRQRYDAADIYLNAPVIDNMPGSILEAFACGLPVVTSDAGGIPYIVRNEENGLLTSANDHLALAKGALRLLADQALALSLTDNARREAETTYTWELVREGWRHVYLDADTEESRTLKE